MSSPWVDLAAALAAGAEAFDVPPNIYPTPAANIVAPAIVIRPDEPWQEPGKFTARRARYVAVALANPGDFASAYEVLERLVDLVVAVVGGTPNSAWAWRSTSAPILDESTGTPFLAAACHLEFAQAD